MTKEQEQRHVYYDRDLGIEAYNLSGVVQKFPNHFHEYYVLGFIYGGRRRLWCKGREYELSTGDLVLFNPRDNHFCVPIDGELLDHRAININVQVMRQAAKEITGKEYLPYFTQNVVYQSDATQSISELYNAILTQTPKLKKEEAFLLLLAQVMQEYSSPFDEVGIVEPDPYIKLVCRYMEENFAANITLAELVQLTDFGKSYLLRSFTKQVGVSPYRYLQAIRIERAKGFLEQGIVPIEAASLAGFSDQSHFSHFFKEFIGLTPKQYQKIFTDNPTPLKVAKEYKYD